MHKKDSEKTKELLKYLPQSISLKQKLQSFYDEGEK